MAPSQPNPGFDYVKGPKNANWTLKYLTKAYNQEIVSRLFVQAHSLIASKTLQSVRLGGDKEGTILTDARHAAEEELIKALGDDLKIEWHPDFCTKATHGVSTYCCGGGFKSSESTNRVSNAPTASTSESKSQTSPPTNTPTLIPSDTETTGLPGNVSALKIGKLASLINQVVHGGL